MSLSSCAFFTMLVSLTFASSVLRGIANRPICTPEQSCSYFNAPYTFSLCICPDFQACPKGPAYSAVVEGVEYRFCQQRQIPVCSCPDEYASTINGILTSVHCICPEGLSQVKAATDADGTIHFTCGLKIHTPSF